jgi:3-dehydroquinate synthase
MKHVFLIGFMGAGKSTVGRLLADMLHLPFVDLDDRITAEDGRKVAEIFDAVGEEGFRALESAALSALADEPASIVACGGGVVTVDANRESMRELGTVVYLRTTVAETLSRIGDRSSRPLLSGDDAEGRASELLDARSALYHDAADIEIETVGVTAAVVARTAADRLATRGAVTTRALTVHVPVPGAEYDVLIGRGLLGRVGELVAEVSSAKMAAVLTDTTVGDLFGVTVTSKLVTAGFATRPLSVPPGEGSKSWATAGEVLEALAELRLDRKDLLVTLGGGVIGDLGGFAAATYLRGIDFVQIPTTLLAQVDSSVGGKTGVDLRAGKNLAGAFKQPVRVIADTALLDSLSDADWGSGLAEIAKSAAIDGETFLTWMEDNADALRKRDSDAVIEAVSRSVAFKAQVVSADEREAGLRECLNYGHTFGHALEKVAGYGAYPHGIAVAEGMRFAIRLSVDAGSASTDMVVRQDALLDRLGLPAIGESYKAGELLAAMKADKKVRAGAVRFVLLECPGVWECSAVEDSLVGDHLAAWSASKRGN